MKIPKITNPLTILQKSRQQQADQRKIQEQEKLIGALKCPKNRPRRRSAMKFASNITTGTK